MRRTAADTLKTKAAILDAATRVFAAVGFDAATLESIGREADLTRGAIYWHFKDKQDLFARIVQRENERLNHVVATALANEHSPLRKLRRLLAAVIDNFYDNETFRLFIELTWYKMHPTQFSAVMEDKTTFVQNFLGLLERLLSEARAAGEIVPTVDVGLTALHFSCLINGFYRLYHVAPERARDKEATRRLFAHVLDTIVPPPPER